MFEAFTFQVIFFPVWHKYDADTQRSVGFVGLCTHTRRVDVGVNKKVENQACC